MAYLYASEDQTVPWLSELSVDAVTRVRSARSAAVTVLSPAGMRFGASDQFARQVDTVQYGCDQGPCISAVAEARIVRSGRIDTDEQRWPRFRAGVAHLGLKSVLSVPLFAREEVVGTLNLYSSTSDGFDDNDVDSAEVVAGTLAGNALVARLRTTADRLASVLTTAMGTAATVEMAVTLLSVTEAISPVAARERLEARARSRGVPLRTVGQELLRDATAEMP